MEITNFGHFKCSNPDAVGVIYYANEDGQDWYEMRRSLTEWDINGAFINAIYGAWATIDPETGELKNVEQDPSRLVPDDRLVLGIDAGYWEIKPSMVYQDGQLVTPAKEDAA